jgi:hypothetical protein
MLHRWIGLVLCAAVLAACGPRADEAEPAASANATVTPQPAASMPASLPAPSETTPRFVGMWAVDQRLCAEPAWRFEADEVSTRGEVHCDFNRISPAPGGYSVAATCIAEAPPAPYQLEFTFAESARAMMITGGPWEQANLIYCGPLTED